MATKTFEDEIKECKEGCGIMNIIVKIVFANGKNQYRHRRRKREIKMNKIRKIKLIEHPKAIILDNNELSLAEYAKEYPENWKKICKGIETGDEK